MRMQRTPSRAHSYCAVACAVITYNAAAQSTEAARYVNNQGIEVIQARAAPKPADTGASQSSAKASGEQEAGAVRSVSVAANPKLHVSASQQMARDKERLAILNQELLKELGEYETKTKVLRSPALSGKLAEAELTRMRELAGEHEKNIRSLQAEINGVRTR